MIVRRKGTSECSYRRCPCKIASLDVDGNVVRHRASIDYISYIVIKRDKIRTPSIRTLRHHNNNPEILYTWLIINKSVISESIKRNVPIERISIENTINPVGSWNSQLSRVEEIIRVSILSTLSVPTSSAPPNGGSVSRAVNVIKLSYLQFNAPCTLLHRVLACSYLAFIVVKFQLALLNLRPPRVITLDSAVLTKFSTCRLLFLSSSTFFLGNSEFFKFNRQQQR